MAETFFSKLQSLFTSDAKIDVSQRYEIIRDAISGTMSNFHQARDVRTGKVVGLKLLDREKTAAFESRFKGLNKPSEGKIATSLKHPRIVETYEFGETKAGQSYIVMEFVPGAGMNLLIPAKDPILDGNRLSLIRQMLEAIDAVHKAGYIHRDICPRNFIVSPDGTSLKLIDFGLTVPAEPPYMQPGNRTGTPLYMAPEIVRRRNTDQRVDIFAFGVTAFYLLAGEHPWPSSDTTGKAALQHDTAAPARLEELRPTVNRTLAKVVHQCLAPLPHHRPASAEAILKALRNVSHEDEQESSSRNTPDRDS
jgi:eukaryotic-like serine/threonine-protein kinase